MAETRLYYHKTDGGDKYLCLRAVPGTDEGDIATVVVRLDGIPKLETLFAAAPELLEALKAVEARLTAVARAFYVDGKAKALKAALTGWKDDIDPARAAIAKAEGDQ